MAIAHAESLPNGTIRVSETCENCGDDVAWDHVAFTDAGKLLVGHCLCPGQQHAFALGPKDKVIGQGGRQL